MRRRLGVLTALFVVVFSGFFATAPAYAATGWTVTCTSPNRGYSCVASSGYVGQSTWGYPVNSPSGAHNCTNYAAYRLARNGASNPGNLGNATDWDNNAAAKGFRVDGSPVVGSIAQWEGNTGPAAGVPEGHVAYVEAVTDSYIDISQDAWGGTTSTARIQRGGSYWPSHFLHIKDLANDNPFGAYDSLTSPGPGLAKVSGWAIDPSSRTTSLSVHVYVDGIYQGAYDASVSRPDVASAYPGSGDRHGYAVTFNIAAGQHTVCVYAINIGAGTETRKSVARRCLSSTVTPSELSTRSRLPRLEPFAYAGGPSTRAIDRHRSTYTSTSADELGREPPVTTSARPQ